MSEITIQLENGNNRFTPGQTISGDIRWNFQEHAESVDLRLIWYTRGKGTEDVGIVDTITFDNPAQFETRQFRFDVPPGPYSFSGKLISLLWALEAVAQPDDQCQRVELTISSKGNEVKI